MDRHRQIAFIVAFIVALLIMMIGKACTDSMIKKQSRPVQSVPATTTPVYNNNSYSNNYNNGYNNTPQQTTVSQQNEVPVQYITNMFGEVVGTEPVVTEVPATDFAEVQTNTQERSILEQYNEGRQGNALPDAVATTQSEVYQIPSEIKITIR